MVGGAHLEDVNSNWGGVGALVIKLTASLCKRRLHLQHSNSKVTHNIHK